MDTDFVKTILGVAQEVQKSVDDIYKPPIEGTPSRTEGVISFTLFRKTRGYIERVVHQINKTYEYDCYDACAVMVRRLVEMLIIESFEAYKIASKIKNPTTGDFLMLQDLIDRTIDETAWNLGRGTKAALPKLKIVGDRSAHNRRYNARRSDIDKIINDLRIVSEELLYISGLKT